MYCRFIRFNEGVGLVKRSLLASLLLGSSVMGLVAGCGTQNSATSTKTTNTTSSTSKSNVPAGKGTVVMALPPLIGINWYQPLRPVAYNSVYDAWAASLMYKGLLHIGTTGKIDLKRSVAQSVKWNKQGTVYTVTINPKWHWSNGSSVTAQDVQFTWDLIKASSAKNAPTP